MALCVALERVHLSSPTPTSAALPRRPPPRSRHVVLDLRVSVAPKQNHIKGAMEGETPETSSWVVVKCTEKKSVGVPDGDSMVNRVELLARVVDPPHVSALRIQETLPPEQDRKRESRLQYGTLVSSDNNLLIIVVTYGYGLQHTQQQHHYLIYDAAASSLVLTLDPSRSKRSSWMPSPPIRGTWPLPVQRGDATVLVFLREHPQLGGGNYWPRRREICLSSWSSSSNSSPSSHATISKPLSLPSDLTPMMDEAFSFGGMLFWVDLLLGAMCCDSEELLGPGPGVQFKFIDLPPGCHLHDATGDPTEFEATMFRTMACSGDSIKFIDIEIWFNHEGTESLLPQPENRKVTMWTLVPETWQWSKGPELLMKDLWSRPEFIDSGVPRCPWAPKNPILNAEEDGVLYLTIDGLHGDKNCTYTRDPHMICVDMHSGCLLSSSRIHPSYVMTAPRLMGSSVFKDLSRERIPRLAGPQDWSGTRRQLRLASN